MTYSTDMIYLVLEKVEKKELVVNISLAFSNTLTRMPR